MQRKAPRTLHFNKSAIEQLHPPDDGREYHYDTKTPGLAVCVTKAGTKTFHLVRRVESKVERIRLGGFPEVTVDQARKQADRHNGKIAEGVNPNDRQRARRGSVTLKEAFDEFLEQPTRTKNKRPRSEKTVHDYRQQFDSCLEPWSSRSLTKITRKDLEKRHSELGEQNGIYQANRVLSLLKAVLNFAVDQSYLDVNPATRLRKFTEESRDRFLEADEFPRFWQALEDEPSEKLRDFFKVCLFTGQRRGNVASMRWDDVNLDSASWTIPKTKSGKHSVPLTMAAVEILKRRKAVAGDTEYVFPGRHGRGHLADPMRAWRGILERAGIDDLRIHDLRRSMGSWQAITGASLPMIGKTLGHTQAQTTAGYARLSSDPVRAAMETATAAMMDAAKPEKKSGRKSKQIAEGNGNG